MSPPLSPASALFRFGPFFRALIAAVEARNGHGSGGLGYQTVRAIVLRIMAIQQQVRRLLERLAQVRYVPREGATRRAGPRDPGAPRKRDPLLTGVGWLQKLIPELAANHGWFRDLLTDPQMAALVEAGPETLRRSLRSIGHMFGTRKSVFPARRRPPSPTAEAAAPQAASPPPPSRPRRPPTPASPHCKISA
jgi:hypothetical protein